MFISLWVYQKDSRGEILLLCIISILKLYLTVSSDVSNLWCLNAFSPTNVVFKDIFHLYFYSFCSYLQTKCVCQFELNTCTGSLLDSFNNECVNPPPPHWNQPVALWTLYYSSVPLVVVRLVVPDLWGHIVWSSNVRLGISSCAAKKNKSMLFKSNSISLLVYQKMFSSLVPKIKITNSNFTPSYSSSTKTSY